MMRQNIKLEVTMRSSVREVLSTTLMITVLVILVPLGWFLTKQLLWGLVFPTGSWLLINTQPVALGVVRGLIARDVTAALVATIIVVVATLLISKPDIPDIE
jgi:hypothetical protein